MGASIKFAFIAKLKCFIKGPAVFHLFCNQNHPRNHGATTTLKINLNWNNTKDLEGLNLKEEVKNTVTEGATIRGVWTPDNRHILSYPTNLHSMPMGSREEYQCRGNWEQRMNLDDDDADGNTNNEDESDNSDNEDDHDNNQDNA